LDFRTNCQRWFIKKKWLEINLILNKRQLKSKSKRFKKIGGYWKV